MNNLIYVPTGKARGYSPLALNVYTGGCDHGCLYCYCRTLARGNWSTLARPRNLAGLAKEAAAADEQILLSFLGDPYCLANDTHNRTREALEVLGEAGCSAAILTKGGTRCLQDMDLFVSWPGNRIKVGATLTFWADRKSHDWEPGAALPEDRIEALRILYQAGVTTWASIEPVIEPAESLAIIEASLPYVHAYALGKWNHDVRANEIDWQAFGVAAVKMIRQAGRRLYVKEDMRKHMPLEFLHDKECSRNALNVPPRPPRQGLLL